MKKIALAVLTATVFANAQMSMLSYIEASDASDNANACVKEYGKRYKY